MNEKLPYVSIIVPVYNGESTIQRCLDSLVNLDYPKERLEIIIVDNNSTDNTKKIINQYPVTYIFEEKRSRARARNKGIEASKGEIICSLDADCVADRNWVKNILKGFNGKNIGACGGRTLAYQPKTWIEKYLNYSTSNFVTIFKDDRFLTPSVSTANAAYLRIIFKDIGFFDEMIMTEDQEFSWRILLNGWQLAYVPEAIVHCKYLDNLVKFFLRFFYSGYDPIIVTQKYRYLINPHTGVKLWVGITNEIYQLLSPALVNLLTKKHRYPLIFSLLEIMRFVSLFLGSSYAWLKMGLDGQKVSPISSPLKDRVSWWSDDRKITVLDSRSAYYYNLNETASCIWEMLEAGKNINEIVDSISQEYEINKEEVEKDVKKFFNILKSNFGHYRTPVTQSLIL